MAPGARNDVDLYKPWNVEKKTGRMIIYSSTVRVFLYKQMGGMMPIMENSRAIVATIFCDFLPILTPHLYSTWSQPPSQLLENHWIGGKSFTRTPWFSQEIWGGFL
jgi:hypothetical protein